MDITEIVAIVVTQAIIWFGGTAIVLGLFIINYAKGKVKWYGVGQALIGVLCICFVLLTQLPAQDPIINIGVQCVKVIEYTLASMGMILGIVIGVFLFLLLLMRK